MPVRIANHAVTVVRDGKRFDLKAGEGFDLSKEELNTFKELNPDAFRVPIKQEVVVVGDSNSVINEGESASSEEEKAAEAEAKAAEEAAKAEEEAKKNSRNTRSSKKASDTDGEGDAL